MENFNFEKQISEKLANAHEQPSSDLFNSIMQKRNQKANPTIPVLYKYGAIALIGIFAFAGFYFYSNNESKFIDNTIVSDVPNPNSKITSSNNLNSNNENSQTKEFSPKLQIVEKEDVAEIISKEFKSVTQTNSDNFETQNSLNEISTNKEVINLEKNSLKTEFVTSNNSKKSNPSMDKNIKNENNNPFENYFNPESSNRPQIEKYENKGTSHLYVYNTFGDYEIDFSNINFLTNRKLNKVKTKYEPTEDISKSNAKYRNFAVNNKRPIFIDLMVTPMFTFHKIIAGTNTARFYKNFEKITPNYFIEGRITIPIKNDFTFYTGLSFGKLNTLYNGKFTEKESVTENVERVIFINDPVTGQSREERFMEQIQVDKYTTFQNNFTNTSTLNQIPLGLGYNFGYKKFDFAVNGGMLINLLHSSIGKDLKYMNENTFNFNGSKTTFDFGYSFGAMAAFNMSRKIKYFIEPTINSFNIDNSNYGSLYQQKITNFGLKLGLRYNLN